MFLLSLTFSVHAAKQYSASSCILLQQQIDDYKRRLGRSSPLYAKAVKTQKRYCQQPVESRVSKAITRAKQLEAQAAFEAQQAEALLAVEPTPKPEPVRANIADSITENDTKPVVKKDTQDVSGVEFYTATQALNQQIENDSNALISDSNEQPVKNSIKASENQVGEEVDVVVNNEKVKPINQPEKVQNDQVIQASNNNEQASFLKSLLTSASMIWLLALVGIILLLGLLIFRVKQKGAKASTAMIGEDIGFTIENCLDNSKYHIIQNVNLALEDGSHTHIDHIIVSTFGIFVIDVIHKSGVVFGNEHQEQWSNTLDKTKHSFQNPIRENLNHIKSLAAILNMPQDNFRAIVIFAKSCSLKTKMPKNVGYAKEMITYIQSIERNAFNQETADEVVAIINKVKLTEVRELDHATSRIISEDVSLDEVSHQNQEITVTESPNTVDAQLFQFEQPEHDKTEQKIDDLTERNIEAFEPSESNIIDTVEKSDDALKQQIITKETESSDVPTPEITSPLKKKSVIELVPLVKPKPRKPKPVEPHLSPESGSENQNDVESSSNKSDQEKPEDEQPS